MRFTYRAISEYLLQALFVAALSQWPNLSFLKSETAEERSARGHPIGQPCVFQAMGGLTGFSSLLSGMARMDASGGPMANTLTQEELDAPITENDHPVLRAHNAMI